MQYTYQDLVDLLVKKQLELEESLEREQALAAHVDEIKAHAKYVGWESPHSKLGNLLANGPNYSLTRRDLIRQAEALGSVAEKLKIEAEDGTFITKINAIKMLDAFSDILRRRAATLTTVTTEETR